MSRRGRALVAGAAVAVLAAGCTSSKGFGVGSAGESSSSAASPSSVATTSTTTVALPPQPVAVWQACSAITGPTGAQCATVQVPLDYAHPGGTKIAVALARRPADGVKIGSLLVDPGGPGASGIDELDYFAQIFSPAILAHFDLVGFDPRGVGRSAPVRCESGPQLDQYFDPDPAPTTDAGFQALVNVSRTFVQGCQTMSGQLLPFLGTANAARDMDQIRQALGEPKLNYLGFSYGTLLGATYAELFPTSIRAMVLDGAVDPAQDPVTANINQAAAFDEELKAFFAECAASPNCAWRPSGSMRAAYDALMARIAAQRLPATSTRTLGPGEAFFGVAVALYDRVLAGLADSLQRASQGDGSVLLQSSDTYTQRNPDGTYSNE